mmetsp:Transcript_12210/g.29835  ORF Transcript_12210/g.29835 Transcript_12210/m.29835 type:complete len:95 (+) Transcript_12210:39-323(+)
MGIKQTLLCLAPLHFLLQSFCSPNSPLATSLCSTTERTSLCHSPPTTDILYDRADDDDELLNNLEIRHQGRDETNHIFSRAIPIAKFKRHKAVA